MAEGLVDRDLVGGLAALEVAGQQVTSKRNGGSVVTLDTGLAFVATPTLQFDIEATRGLSDAAADFESGVGVSIKF